MLFNQEFRIPRLPSLPEDVILDIFVRLPAKCIGRYRCLSKSWRHLLSELHFINRHIAQTRLFVDNELFMLSSENFNDYYSGTIVRHSYDEITVLAMELNFVVSPKVRVWGTSSCDGLILLKDAKSGSLLVNPTTKEVQELNIPPHDLDPHPRDTTYGLGYDHFNDDYKVVALCCYFLEHELKMFADVYSVRNGSWKQVESSPYHHVSPGVFLGGSIHWIALNPSDYLNVGYYGFHTYFIAGFDLTKEKFWKVATPSSMFDEDSSYIYSLGILGECLCMFSSVSEKKINIWVMKEYGVMQSWTKISIVDEQGSQLRPFKGVMGQRELVILKDDRTPDERFSMYNLDTAGFQDMTVKGINGGFNLGWSFKETLVSPYYKHN